MEGMPMLPRSAWIVAALVGLVLAGAPLRADDEKIEGDLKKVQGEWSGRIMQSEALYTFKGKKLTVKGAARTYEMTVTLNAEAKPEKSIDLKIDEGPADAKGQTSPGIYKFDGDDKLVICFAPTGARPQKFEQKGDEQFVIEMTRKK
jgi:uncharacterized protein (TIGR03067 family)